MLTSDIRNTQDPSASLLNHPSLVWQKRLGTGGRIGNRDAAIREVALVAIGAGLVWSLLFSVNKTSRRTGCARTSSAL